MEKVLFLNSIKSGYVRQVGTPHIGINLFGSNGLRCINLGKLHFNDITWIWTNLKINTLNARYTANFQIENEFGNMIDSILKILNLHEEKRYFPKVYFYNKPRKSIRMKVENNVGNLIIFPNIKTVSATLDIRKYNKIINTECHGDDDVLKYVYIKGPSEYILDSNTLSCAIVLTVKDVEKYKEYSTFEICEELQHDKKEIEDIVDTITKSWENRRNILVPTNLFNMEIEREVLKRFTFDLVTCYRRGVINKCVVVYCPENINYNIMSRGENNCFLLNPKKQHNNRSDTTTAIQGM